MTDKAVDTPESREDAFNDERFATVQEVMMWALQGPPDPSRLPGTEAKRFAGVLLQTVQHLDYIEYKLKGTAAALSRRPVPWWTLKGKEKKERIFQDAIKRATLEDMPRSWDVSDADATRLAKLKLGGEPWRGTMDEATLRAVIERASLSPTLGQGIVRRKLRAAGVLYVAQIAGLKVSRGRSSPPPYLTACDAFAMAEEIWKRGEAKDDPHARDVAMIMLTLLTCTPELSATLQITNMARKEAEKIVKLKTESEVEPALQASVDLLAEELKKAGASHQPIIASATFIELWHKYERVTGAGSAVAQAALQSLYSWQACLPFPLGNELVERAVKRLEWLGRGGARPWDAAAVEKGIKELESKESPE